MAMTTTISRTTEPVLQPSTAQLAREYERFVGDRNSPESRDAYRKLAFRIKDVGITRVDGWIYRWSDCGASLERLPAGHRPGVRNPK